MLGTRTQQLINRKSRSNEIIRYSAVVIWLYLGAIEILKEKGVSMFDSIEHNVKASGENKAGAAALLLTGRKGTWFKFKAGQPKYTKTVEVVIHTALIVRLSDTRVNTADGEWYPLEPVQYEKLCAILSQFEGMECGDDNSAASD